ncbi:glycoside hydrolase domain-containing protein [Streptomyces sp. NPDC007088]|uniref:glycoside hydrolase domain-containing protein n=1 Tax=Streptomyces sp. NPDC007088 TaxID=3364773 RepID=UPI0036B24E12
MIRQTFPPSAPVPARHVPALPAPVLVLVLALLCTVLLPAQGARAGGVAEDDGVGGEATWSWAGAGADWTVLGVPVFEGRAFDTCTAPPLSTMRGWRDSGYGGVGVYFGGRGRACPSQPYLDAEWTRGVSALGWSVLPVYVGSQAPCVAAENKQAVRIGADPVAQGEREGRDAVRRAAEVGIGSRSPLYLDMEQYDHRDAQCAATTLSFVRAWNRAVRAEGYVSGFYSSADSGVAHMERARRAGVADLPEVMWFARWGGEGSVDREPSLAAGAWQPQRRVHQYRGNVRETHGGVTLNVDRNMVDAPVARIG